MPDEGKANPIPQVVAAVVGAIGAFSLGTALGWANVVQEELQSGQYHFPCTKDEFSWISSTFVLGAMLTCMPSGVFINLIGRKWTMIAMSIPFLIGWALVIISPNVYVMYVGRFLLGFSGGSFCVSIPVYTGEIAQKEIRGTLGTLFQFMVVLGILFMYSIGAVMKLFTISVISVVFPAVMGVCMLFMPESPTYYIKKGNVENAEKSYAWLRGKDYDSKGEIDDVKAADAFEKAHPVSIPKAFKRPETKRAFLISSMLMVFQQLNGINAVIFYSTDIFRDAKTGIDPAFSTVLLGIVQVIATFISMMLIDRLGRKILLIASASGMALSTAALGIFFLIKKSDPVLADSMGWLPVTSLCGFIIFFSIGYGPIPWIMMGEVFSTDIKGFAGSLSATLNWMFAFFITKTFVNLQDLLGTGGAFFFFTGCTVVGIFFVLFVVIETKGKSLNEIQAALTSASA